MNRLNIVNHVAFFSVNYSEGRLRHLSSRPTAIFNYERKKTFAKIPWRSDKR